MKGVLAPKYFLILGIVLVGAVFAAVSVTVGKPPDAAVKTEAAAVNPEAGNSVAPPASGTITNFDLGEGDLFPAPSEFRLAAENALLQLKVHPGSGHFIVLNKATGKIWRSYPNPDGWTGAEDSAALKSQLRSPISVRYVEFNMQQHLLKDANMLDRQGQIGDFQLTGDGFSLSYLMPDLGFAIPVRVSLKDDYVETTIRSEGLKDGKTAEEAALAAEKRGNRKDPDARIVSIRLYPLLGAETSQRQGYLFIPDGSGALIDFKRNHSGISNSLYNERIYGEDWAYSHNNPGSTRQPVRMPVFGIQSGDGAVLGVAGSGAEYGTIIAAPSGSFSSYNWATAEHGYRFKFFQPTNSRKTTGIMTYSGSRTESDRTVRYYFLVNDKADYIGMAGRYRRHLMEEQGLQPFTPADSDAITFGIDLLGADTKKGFMRDTYTPLTTTSQAKEILRMLSSLGVPQMRITYKGWQRGGASEFGGALPVDAGIGGNAGMREFVSLAHSKGATVSLDASSYIYNNNGKDGFHKNRDGVQDLGSYVIDYEGRTLVNPRFTAKTIRSDLGGMKELGVDGLAFGRGIGRLLNSDYNDRSSVSRMESREIQEEIIGRTAANLGGANVSEGNFYALKHVDHVFGLAPAYSFDLFVDHTVPFAQIALHGLVSYSSGYANLSDNYNDALLHAIAYGETPSFLLTYAPSQELIGTRSSEEYYTTYYKDWADEIARQYQRFTEALGDVQDKFIVDFRTLAPGVSETAYSNGQRVIVNFNDQPYAHSGLYVDSGGFAVAKEGLHEEKH